MLCVFISGPTQLALSTRRMFKTQAALFVGIFVLGRAAEHVNTFLGTRWRSFATQNYFDPNGVFMSVMFSMPLAVILLVMVVRAIMLGMDVLYSVGGTVSCDCPTAFRSPIS